MADSALTTNPSRRHVVAAVAAVAVSAGGGSAVAGETHILRLFREHQVLRAASKAYVYTGDPDDEDETMETLFYRHADLIEAEMMALPSTCAAYVAAKMLVAHGAPSLELSCLHSDDPVWVEARELTGVSA